MAFTPQEEQQLRELLNNTTPLKDQPTLAASEFTTAILGAVHDDTGQGRLRQLGFAIVHQALQAANPLKFTRDLIFHRTPDIAIGTERPTRTLIYPSLLDNRTYTLDNKPGTSTPYNFDDYVLLIFTYIFETNRRILGGNTRYTQKYDYFQYKINSPQTEVIYSSESATSQPLIVSTDFFKSSLNGAKLISGGTMEENGGIYFVSNTEFNFNRGTSTYGRQNLTYKREMIHRIEGIGLSLQSPA